MDDLRAHRSDDPRALRRHRIQPQSSEKLLRTQPLLSPKKQFDHSPHEVFVQLDELQGNMDEWKETARWIKYEEDVEEGADRWGKPHVAPLSFHSLLNLRLFLEQGVVLLDLEERDFPGVAYKVIEMVIIAILFISIFELIEYVMIYVFHLLLFFLFNLDGQQRAYPSR